MKSSAFEFEVDDDERILVAPGLRLAFRWTGDRWTHTIEVERSDRPGWLRAVNALEGEPNRNDPDAVLSPAYQELERHPFEGGVRALLTGQAGPHHFSAVVTARDEDESVLLDFDLADRCRLQMRALSCTYEIALEPGELIDAGPRRIVWGGDALGAARLEFIADPPAQVALSESGCRAVRVQTLVHIDNTSFTHRCHYQWRWTAG